MDDDLNTPLANTIILRFTNILNKAIEEDFIAMGKVSSQTVKNYSVYRDLLQLLAIESLKPNKLDLVVEFLLELRQTARLNKDFSEADKIRKKILELNYILEDKPWGTIFLPNSVEEGRKD